jgi:hypothetical protein
MTVETITTTIVELETKLEKARRAKKATKDLRAQIEALQAEAEKITAEASKTETKRPVGRPRKYVAEYYVLKGELARNGRGRPSREVVLSDLESLGQESYEVAYVDEIPTRTLELLRKAAVTRALNRVKVVA